MLKDPDTPQRGFRGWPQPYRVLSCVCHVYLPSWIA